MIRDTFAYGRWEWFKLRRRPLAWVLLGVLVLGTQSSVWDARASYRKAHTEQGILPLTRSGLPGLVGERGVVDCARLEVAALDGPLAGASEEVLTALAERCRQHQSEGREMLAMRWRGVSIPGSLSVALVIARNLGLLLVAVLAASTVGNEYGLGTLRPILVRGVPRPSVLAGKLLVIVVAAGVGIGVVLVSTAIGSLAATATLPPPAELAPGGPEWPEVLGGALRVWLALIPFAVFAGVLAIVTRSSTAATAAALGYYFVELMAASRMGSGAGLLAGMGEYLLVCNTHLASGGRGAGLTALCATDAGEARAWLVLGAYTAACCLAATLVFVRRDVTGARGD